MKCIFCDADFTPHKNQKYSVCPFCKRPVLSMEHSVDSLKEVLSNLVAQFGNQIITDKGIVLRCVEVFLPKQKREYNFANMAYSGGIVNLIFSASHTSPERQKNILTQAASMLEEAYGVSQEWAELIVDSFAESLGMTPMQDNSFYELQAKAEKGSHQAQYNLAIYYYQQKNDIASYLHWMKLAASGGYEEARLHLGTHLYTTQLSDSVAQQEGINLILNVAKSGNQDALCFLAKRISELPMYNSCITALVTDILKKDTLQCSAKQWIDLSYYYEAKKNTDKSLKCAENAYKEDPITAWKRYVELLENSTTIEDSAKSGKVLREMVEDGNVQAMIQLAQKIERSADNDASMKPALYWYKMAADSGNLQSQIHLAQLYEHGELCKKDLEQAVYWYEVAAANGSQKAYSKISFKNKRCIRQTVDLQSENDEILKCKFNGHISMEGKDYIIITDPDSGEMVPLLYLENGHDGDFEVEILEEDEEKHILREFKRNLLCGKVINNLLK